MTSNHAVLLALPLLLLGCGGTTTPTPEHPEGGAGGKPPSELVQQVDRVTVAGYSTAELVQQLEHARSLLLVDDFDQAAEAFDRLMRLATDPAFVALAAYNSAMAYEGLGKRELAIARYRKLVDDHADQSVSKSGLLRLARLLGRMERWGDLDQAATKLLARTDLVLIDRIEAHGARTLALVEQGLIDEAAIQLGKATALIDQNAIGRTGTPPVQLAQVSFAEGEIRRIRSESIKLVPVPPNFVEVLEARCQGLLDAQREIGRAHV